MSDNLASIAIPQDPASVEAWGRRLDWGAWETVVRKNGVTIDRARGSTHPVHASITYPIDYGFVNGTTSTDGEEIDVFLGTAATGLVAAIWTTDYRKGDRECKLLVDCTPSEIYLVHGFLNFDRRLMEGVIVMRRPIEELFDG